MNKRFIDYQERSIQDLKDPKEAVAYLNAAFMDSDPRLFLMALKHVVVAQGNMADLAKKTTLNRENLYRMLSKKGNPKFTSIVPVLRSLGFNISIELSKGSK